MKREENFKKIEEKISEEKSAKNKSSQSDQVTQFSHRGVSSGFFHEIKKKMDQLEMKEICCLPNETINSRTNDTNKKFIDDKVDEADNEWKAIESL